MREASVPRPRRGRRRGEERGTRNGPLASQLPWRQIDRPHTTDGAVGRCGGGGGWWVVADVRDRELPNSRHNDPVRRRCRAYAAALGWFGSRGVREPKRTGAVMKNSSTFFESVARRPGGKGFLILGEPHVTFGYTE